MTTVLDFECAAIAPTYVIEQETAFDVARREQLLDAAMGPARRRKSSEKLRRGRMPADGLAFAARNADGQLIGTVRLWNVQAGIGSDGRPLPALLLGLLAVDPAFEGYGIGSALMRAAICEAKRLGHGAILLVGDAPYYARFVFSADKTETLVMPGPFERGRFLGLELKDGWLDGATGLLVASGKKLKSNSLKMAA